MTFMDYNKEFVKHFSKDYRSHHRGFLIVVIFQMPFDDYNKEFLKQG